MEWFEISRDGYVSKSCVMANVNDWIRVAPLDILPGDIYEKVKNLVIVELVKKVKFLL